MTVAPLGQYPPSLSWAHLAVSKWSAYTGKSLTSNSSCFQID